MNIVTPSDPEALDGLAMAMIEWSNTPLVLLGRDLAVIAISKSFREAFQIAPADVGGGPFAALGDGAWSAPTLDSLLRDTLAGKAAIEAYDMDWTHGHAPPRHLILNARKLDYAAAGEARLLLAVADVTDARAADELNGKLLREKEVLLHELQHRVANSLQIIASVLLQSARKVESEETRGHLYDAHSRVMSVAAVQRQLATTRLGEVALCAYFTELCDSIGNSMIQDHDELTIAVSVDDSITTADVSASLGLIVTELVINALKHAFPGHRRGTITVDYHANGPAWTLSVSDDGVGMPDDPASAKPGLGTGIIEALSKQLHARVEISDAAPGTRVAIVHD